MKFYYEHGIETGFFHGIVILKRISIHIHGLFTPTELPIWYVLSTVEGKGSGFDNSLDAERPEGFGEDRLESVEPSGHCAASVK